VVLVVLVVPGRPFVVEKDQKNMNQYRFSTLFSVKCGKLERTSPNSPPFKMAPFKWHSPSPASWFWPGANAISAHDSARKTTEKGGKSQPQITAAGGGLP
jgi:hypothetical protein